MTKYATTFGSSTITEDTIEYKEGILIGRKLSKCGYSVKCGGYQGLMEAISKGVYQNGGECIGIALEAFETIRPENTYLTKKIVHSTMFDRLKALIEDSELFIVQRGSLGTINEAMMVWTLLYVDLLKKNSRLCFIGKEWQHCINPKNMLIDEKLFELIEFYDSAEDFLETLN